MLYSNPKIAFVSFSKDDISCFPSCRLSGSRDEERKREEDTKLKETMVIEKKEGDKVWMSTVDDKVG